MLLREFSERVAAKSGVTIPWETILPILLSFLESCLNKPAALAEAIEKPTWQQRAMLRRRCCDSFGWLKGWRVADRIIDEAKPFKSEKAGIVSGGTFEDMLLSEASEL